MTFLKRLFSETKAFDEIRFKDGLNIIIGEYETEKGRRGELNGIGKTLIVNLIDLMFLSSASRNLFQQKKFTFLRNHTATLELEIKGESFFIKKEFNKLSKVKLGMNFSKLIEYSIKEAKTILFDNIFGHLDYEGDIYSKYFRDLIIFFIKDDSKISSITNPVNFIHTSKKKGDYLNINLILMNLPNYNFSNAVKINETISVFEDQKTNLIESMEQNGNNYNEIKSEKILLEERIKQYEEQIDFFRINKLYEDLEEEILNLSNDVSSLLKKKHEIEIRLKNLKKSFELKLPEFDKDQVIRIYNEVNKKITPIIKDKLQQVLEFREKLSLNRKNFLNSEIDNLNKQRKEIQEKLIDLDSRRSKLYQKLDEKDALDSIKNIYEKLIKEKEKYEEINTYFKKIDSVELKITEEKVNKSKSEKILKKEISDLKQEREKISSTFLNIVKKTINLQEKITEAFLNIEFFEATRSNEIPLKIEVQVPREDSLGKTRYKLFVYDFTIFIRNIIENRYVPKFIIHDGIFTEMDTLTKVNVLNYIFQESKVRNFQYITTLKSNDLLIEEKMKDELGYNFLPDDYVICRLGDIQEKMFFKNEF